MAKKLYIGNLSYDVDQSDLEQLLGQYGQVEDAVVIMDRMSGRSKGFGFVTMADDDAATTAIAELDGKEYTGRALKVNEAKPREERGGGGGGGGGRGGRGGRGGGGGGGRGGYGGGGGGRDRY
ncbi:MAG: RNA-binding protein [Phycisphaerae bacterium]|nr:RNA-binding protein [Phycisphaerae bacterium]